MTERLVVVGGDAAGMSAATNARRLRPAADLEIVALEKGRWTSYSACGIPFLVGGEVREVDDLVARTPEEFRERHDIDARTEHEALEIDLDRREVEVRDHARGSTYRLGFDLLHIATGAEPFRPPIPGLDHPCVHGVQTLEDGVDLVGHAEQLGARRVVVVGGGYIGLEVAEAFVRRGSTVTVLERSPAVMSTTFDADMATHISEAMRAEGVDVRCGEEVVAVEPLGREPSDGVAVVTAASRVPADLVVLGLGVVPRTQLARDAGIALGVRGSIAVDRRQRTGTDGVWAAGDCCQTFHRVARRDVHVALGTVANKQGRVAGIDIGGGSSAFPGVVGTAVSGFCGIEVGRTGLTERECGVHGVPFDVATVESTTTAGYMPGAQPLRVKLLAESGTGRLLGGQIIGGRGAAKRVDVLAAALFADMSVQDVVDLDLGYAPPFSTVWDPVQVAARKLLGS